MERTNLTVVIIVAITLTCTLVFAIARIYESQDGSGALVTCLVGERVISLMMGSLDTLRDRVTAFMVGAPVTCLVGDWVAFGIQ